MSHFTVMVIGENPEEQLSRYDENLDVPRYVKATKQQLIDEWKKRTEEYKNGTYAEFLADPDKYKEGCRNDAHINYLENEFPKRLNWTDEQIYAYQVEDYGDVGEDGEVYSTYNPESKWDWFILGGRWSGMIQLKEGAEGLKGESGVFDNETGIDQAKKGDITNLNDLKTFAIVKGGKWYEKGQMGWWGIVIDGKDEEQWEEEQKKLIEGLPDDNLISIYDCHI